MKIGLIQVHGTCWFYSVVNCMLLSKLGRRILFRQMLEYFNKLNKVDKAHFFNVAKTCKKDPTKNLLYFYTFMFHFWATTLQYRKGNSPNLVTNVLPNLTRNQAIVGRYPNEQREKMFNKLGITYTIMDVYKGGQITKDTDTLIIRNSESISKIFHVPYFPLHKTIRNYELDSCLLRLVPKSGSKGNSHAIAGVRNPDTGAFYIVDSHGYTYDVDWSDGTKLVKILEIPRYTDKYDRVVFDSYMYVNTTNLPVFDTKLFKQVDSSPAPAPPPALGKNSKGRQIHKGARGGLYVLQGGRKIYTFKTASVAVSKPVSLGKNSKGRQIHKGARGGLYVLQGGRKIYKFT